MTHNRLLKSITEKRKIELKNFYNAEPMVRSIEEIKEMQEPLLLLLQDIQSEHYIPRIKIVDNQKTKAKFYNDDVAKVVIESVLNALDNLKKDYEKQIKRI